MLIKLELILRIIKWRYIFFLLSFIFFMGLHPFLAINRPVATKVMVIEGWIPDAALNYVVRLFKAKKYQWIVTNGGRIDPGEVTNKKKDNYAEQTKATLVCKGIDPDIIYAVKSKKIDGSKTYGFAKSTISWLAENKKTINAINILTLDAHARKSYVLYKKAADNQMDVGVIAIPPLKYHPCCWFFSFYGIRFVLKNFVGYIYALIV